MNLKNIALEFMRKITLIALFSSLLFMFSCVEGVSENDKKIEEAVANQVNTYPLSRLQDIYKNFFQDKFGPGHIIANSSAADAYLRSELESICKNSDSYPDSLKNHPVSYYEPTGADGRFYRVGLSVIRDSIVPYDVFFDAFLRSVNGIEFPTIEQWQKEWKHIEEIISAMPQCPDGFAEDQAAIEQLLLGGEYVMHHSKIYSETYDPHYRIIERSIFEQEILPLIEKQ